MKPEMIAFHMSSFCLHPLTAQSNVENMPPQTPKLPPVTGARALMTERAPTSRSPYVARSELSSHRTCMSTHPWRVPSTLDTVPDGTADRTHRESATEVGETHPRAEQREQIYDQPCSLSQRRRVLAMGLWCDQRGPCRVVVGVVHR